MASKGKNLSNEEQFPITNPEKIKIGLVVSQWNQTITDRLLNGAKSVLLNSKIPAENIIIKYVPGTFELPLGAQYLFEKNMVDGIICIGCVIQGETKHFDFFCQAVSQGSKDLNVLSEIPVIFCVLTDNTLKQAQERSGGKHGNKGVEAAIAALQIANLKPKKA